MKGDDDPKHQEDRELGYEGRANRCEPLINVVIGNKPKVLKNPNRSTGLGQKANGQE